MTEDIFFPLSASSEIVISHHTYTSQQKADVFWKTTTSDDALPLSFRSGTTHFGYMANYAFGHGSSIKVMEGWVAW